jgi:hypothetical protein
MPRLCDVTPPAETIKTSCPQEHAHLSSAGNKGLSGSFSDEKEKNLLFLKKKKLKHDFSFRRGSH